MLFVLQKSLYIPGFTAASVHLMNGLDGVLRMRTAHHASFLILRYSAFDLQRSLKFQDSLVHVMHHEMHATLLLFRLMHIYSVFFCELCHTDPHVCVFQCI